MLPAKDRFALDRNIAAWIDAAPALTVVLDFLNMSIYHVHMSTHKSPVPVAAARFKADCLKLIDQMGRDRRPVTITKRGRPVAVLSPVTSSAPVAIIGALAGSVLRYDDPFAPAVPPGDWDAAS